MVSKDVVAVDQTCGVQHGVDVEMRPVDAGNGGASTQGASGVGAGVSGGSGVVAAVGKNGASLGGSGSGPEPTESPHSRSSGSANFPQIFPSSPTTPASFIGETVFPTARFGWGDADTTSATPTRQTHSNRGMSSSHIEAVSVCNTEYSRPSRLASSAHAGDSGSCFGAGIGAWGNALPLAYQHDEESEASEVVGLHATNISAFDLVPVFEAQEDLPSEWRETQDRLARSWRNSYHALGFLGHIFWVAIGIAPVALGAGVWKAHTLGEEDHGQPWGHVDVCITLALLVAYTMACVQSYYPGGRVLPAAASFSVWCVAVVVEMAFSDGRSAYVGDLSLVVPVAYWVSVGVLVFIAQRRFAENWTALQMAAPFSLTAVTVVFITSYVVPAMEDATDVQKLLVRCGWTVVVVAPTVTLLLKVHEAHLLLPNLVRLPIAGMEMSLLLPSKVVLYCMPVEWALLSEVFAQALRVLLAFLLMRWQTGLKTGKGACLASQVVFVSVQTDTCSSVAAAIIVCTRRGDRPASEVMSTLIIGAILPVLMSLFASAIQSVLLHKRKVPISCVYWMFQKVQHYLVMAAATTIATMITSPQILRLLEREEVRVNFL